MTLAKTVRRITGGVTLFLLIMIITTIGVLAEGKIDKQTIENADAMVRDVMRKSKIPDVSIAIIQGEHTEYLSYGADTTNQDSLYQIGSVTKAYTGLGVLLLEEEGKLSINDPISKYIPWFTATYKGETVNPAELTIANFLYQTSGFTNDESKYPSATVGMSIEDNVRNVYNKELTFYPSEQYAYANTNFNTLGLLIEIVSGQSYEDFMTENILQPLGLNQTYVNPQKVEETNKIVSGNRLSFLHTFQYDISIPEGIIPAGYIISSASDMGRWLQIQMGAIEVSPQFKKIIEKSHIPNAGSIVDDSTHYASGWFIDDGGTIYHSGGTPNYSSRVAIRPDQNIAVCVLTNMNASANTNYIADNVLNILEGKPTAPYQADIWYIFDTIFTVITFISIPLVLLTVIFLFRTFKQEKMGLRNRMKLSRKKIALIILPVLLVLLSLAIIITLPLIFGSTWFDMGIWAPASIYWGTISFTIMSVLLFVSTIVVGKRPKINR